MGVDRLPSGSYRARLMVGGQTHRATLATEPETAEIGTLLEEVGADTSDASYAESRSLHS